jgi:hypothetical protein
MEDLGTDTFKLELTHRGLEALDEHVVARFASRVKWMLENNGKEAKYVVVKIIGLE